MSRAVKGKNKRVSLIWIDFQNNFSADFCFTYLVWLFCYNDMSYWFVFLVCILTITKSDLLKHVKVRCFKSLYCTYCFFLSKVCEMAFNVLKCSMSACAWFEIELKPQLNNVKINSYCIHTIEKFCDESKVEGNKIQSFFSHFRFNFSQRPR